jgi:hypothetical protein
MNEKLNKIINGPLKIFNFFFYVCLTNAALINFHFVLEFFVNQVESIFIL